MINTDLDLLKNVLRGNRQEICCVYGEPASGKTTLAKEAAIHQSNNGNKVIFIDSENSFSTERIMQLCENKKDILDNIFVLKPKNLKQQGDYLNSLLNLKDIKLVIVDTLGVYYRLELKKNVKEANNEMNRQFNFLSELCLKGISVLITNQVYHNIDNKSISIVGGEMFKNWSKCLIKLEKIPRKLILQKPETKEVLFEIGNSGLQ
jgi:RecA/RadA recombinase